MAPLVVQAATTYTYDISSTFSSGTRLNTDGWNDASNNWVTASYTGDLYARNNTGSDSTIYRANDINFGFTIPTGSTRIQLTITSRTPGFWVAGLAQGAASRVGIGADFSNSNKFYIFDNSTRLSESGTSANGTDQYVNLTLDFDLISRTADLILDPNGANTLLLDDQAMGIPISTVEATNSLFIRTNTAFSGPATISLTVIPEPSSALLGGLGALVLLRRRRR